VAKPCINRDIVRADPAHCQSLAGYGVATVHEAQDRRGLLDSRMRPISDGWSIAGPAVTSLNHPGDNLMIHAALDICQPGDVLVIASTAPSVCGVLGELLARQAKVKGLAGLVIDIGIRDLRDLRELGLPIWTTAVTAAGSVKATPGWVNVPMVCAGALVNPGDAVVADDDGVVIVPRDEAAEVIEASEARLQKEAAARARYDAGESSMDVNNLRELVAKFGL
jgi:4-hydroxy-4-methyl-2-oxoglutarate aldolase